MKQTPEQRIRWLPLAMGALVGLAALILLVTSLFKEEIFPEYSPAHRGAHVAVEAGCFSCHGTTNGAGSPNPSLQQDSRVPSLFGERHSVEELRQWIEDGISERKRRSESYQTASEGKILKMPAYRDRLSNEAVEDLIAFVALGQYRQSAQEVPTVSQGEEVARKLACFTCHGELGQGGVDNPKSLKGYIPGFFGTDFRALTRNGDPEDLREWILKGASAFFLDQGFAGFYPGRFFTNRQAIRMPPYKDHVNTAELESLVGYLQELMDLGPLTAEALMRYRPIHTEFEAGTDIRKGSEFLPDSADEAFETSFAEAKMILESHCVSCHGSEKEKSSYRLDTREAAIRGGEISEFLNTAAIKPEKASESLLMIFVEAEAEDPDREIYPMPPGKKPRLTAREKSILQEWIDKGARWPAGIELKSTETD